MPLVNRPDSHINLVRLLLFLIGIITVLHLVPAPAAGVSSEHYPDRISKQYRLAKAYYHNLLADEGIGLRRNAWLNCISSFQKIYQSDKKGKIAPACLFMMGRIYYDMFKRNANPLDLGESISYFKELAYQFPEHRLADDALFRVAGIYLDDKNNKKYAARTFAKIVAVYPDGDMAGAAAGMLEKTKGTPGESTAGPDGRGNGLRDPGTPRTETAAIKPLRFWSTNNYTRVVIESSAPIDYQEHLLKKIGGLPRRLYVDLFNSRVSSDLQNTVPIADGLLKQVRSAQYSADTVRVVLDIQTLSDYTIFSLQSPFRVVIDVKGQGIKKTAETTVKGDKPTLAQQLGLGIKKIVLDPGHGGKDPGAIGPKGLLEKDIVLKVAKKTAGELRHALSCEVVLTRDRDKFIPLEERTAIANTRGGDLFVSIHANAAPSSRARGIETYFLNFATNEEAMRVAARENANSTRQLSELQDILMDLIRNAKINESEKLAGYVQENLVNGLKRKYSGVKNLGVKQAPFIVLIGAQMPAILSEIAFISNPDEAHNLRNDKFLDAVARQISAGVTRYVNELNAARMNPPAQRAARLAAF